MITIDLAKLPSMLAMRLTKDLCDRLYITQDDLEKDFINDDGYNTHKGKAYDDALIWVKEIKELITHIREEYNKVK
ncbi:MAG: hypothetical protein M0R17_02835 [Candidatus Omnitrophica bacterium]|jgi:hypothetical protein|nr:hypothetical protein [Candidatus Omnitrophota bacterium]